MILCVLVLGDELAKDNQQALYVSTQLADLGLHVVVKGAIA